MTGLAGVDGDDATTIATSGQTRQEFRTQEVPVRRPLLAGSSHRHVSAADPGGQVR